MAISIAHSRTPELMLLTIKVMIMESVLANPVLLRWRVQQIVAVTKSITKTHKLDHMVGNQTGTWPSDWEPVLPEIVERML
jgi:hypothetical protein